MNAREYLAEVAATAKTPPRAVRDLAAGVAFQAITDWQAASPGALNPTMAGHVADCLLVDGLLVAPSLAERDVPRLAAALAAVLDLRDALAAEWEQTLRALRNVPQPREDEHSCQTDYWRWQGRAEHQRQTLGRLDAILDALGAQS
jgi:hypothetical protein